MTYILGFTDYDGTQVFLKGESNTEFFEEATQYGTHEDAMFAYSSFERKYQNRLNIFELENGDLTGVSL